MLVTSRTASCRMARLNSFLRRAAAILPGSGSGARAGNGIVQIGHPSLRRCAAPVRPEAISTPNFQRLVKVCSHAPLVVWPLRPRFRLSIDRCKHPVESSTA